MIMLSFFGVKKMFILTPRQKKTKNEKPNHIRNLKTNKQQKSS